MKDTGQLRTKLLVLWAKYDKGDIDAAEAKTHISFARATLDTLKVEIAAAHLSAGIIPAVSMSSPVGLQSKGKRIQ